MIIYPAIDLRGGHVVRLKEGDPNRQTTFSHDPITTARTWLERGATWLHIVNLDGAFAQANNNGHILEQIARLDAKVQFGGGLRSIADIEQAIEQGATRVVLGTIAIEQPEIIPQVIERWGSEAICVALDARNGKITTHGWQKITALTPAQFGKQLAESGLKHALYTDVSRDGALTGVNVEATIALAHESGLQVIASGGVSSLDDIRQLAQSRAVAGVIIGMALYEKQLTLEEALAIAGGENAR